MVLVGPPGHAPVGLQLRQRLLPPLAARRARARGPRGRRPSAATRSLAFCASPAAPGVAALEQLDGARQPRDRVAARVGFVARRTSSTTSRGRSGAAPAGEPCRAATGRGRRAFGHRSVRAYPAERRTGRPEGGPWRLVRRCPGSDLLSHPVAQAVPSALEGLTSGFGMGPGVSPPLWPPKRWSPRSSGTWIEGAALEQSSRTTIASASESQVLGLLVPVSSTRCRASTSGLSTSWSSRGLTWSDPVGDLISGRASHLDAFSAYPFRTWLTSRAAGATTGTPEVRPPRSSRTRGSSPQDLLRPQRIGTELSHDVLNPARVPL